MEHETLFYILVYHIVGQNKQTGYIYLFIFPNSILMLLELEITESIVTCEAEI